MATFGFQTGVGTIVETAELEDGAVTNAKVAVTAAIARTKLADVSATSRVVGRVSAGAGADEELTLTQVLDFIGSAAQGDILYRNATVWARLATGAAGELLKSGGAGANPAWVEAHRGIFKQGIGQKDASEASTTQVFAHSVGVAPKRIRLTAFVDSQDACSVGAWRGAGDENFLSKDNANVLTNGGGVAIRISTTAGNYQTGAVTVDATNITITWTKTGTPSGVFYFLWEAEA